MKRGWEEEIFFEFFMREQTDTIAPLEIEYSILDRGVITTKATKAAALVDFLGYDKLYKKWLEQLGRFE